MYRDDREHGAGFTAGMVTGALVGAGLALLFAPKSGLALREEVEESMTSVRDAVAKRYRELAVRAGVELDNLQERVEQVTDTVESGARELVDAATQTARKSGRSARS